MTAKSEYHSNFAAARASAGDGLGRAGHGTHGQRGLFDRIDWFESLHSACLSQSAPLIAAADDGAGNSCWLFLTGNRQGMTSIANYYSFTWGPIAVGLSSLPAQSPMLDTLALGLRGHTAALALSSMRESDATAITAALQAAGWNTDVAATGHNHWLDTAGRSFADWWAQRPGALRSTVQRKGKKGLVALSITDRFSDSDWNDYESVYCQSWKPAESYPEFLRAWARGEADAGTLRLGIARIDGVAVAAQFWSCDNGTAYIHKLAHVAGHDALSPGTLLTHALFAHAFDVDRVDRIDFGTGDDGYKRDWMEQSAALYTVRAWDKKQPAAWYGLGRHVLSRLAARLLGR